MSFQDFIKESCLFWEEAPYMDGFKSDYAALYFAIADSVNKNFWKDTDIEYDRIINKVKMGKRMYLEARSWLHRNGFITFTPGRNDYAKAKFNIVVHFCTATNTTAIPTSSTSEYTSTDTASDTAASTQFNKTINNKTINNEQDDSDADRVDTPPPDDSSSIIPLTPQKHPEKRFKPPTVEEIGEYVKDKHECSSSAAKLFSETFWNHYESNGWMVGKNKMKSWQAAVSGTWKKTLEEFKAKYPTSVQPTRRYLNGTY